MNKLVLSSQCLAGTKMYPRWLWLPIWKSGQRTESGEACQRKTAVFQQRKATLWRKRNTWLQLRERATALTSSVYWISILYCKSLEFNSWCSTHMHKFSSYLQSSHSFWPLISSSLLWWLNRDFYKSYWRMWFLQSR